MNRLSRTIQRRREKKSMLLRFLCSLDSTSCHYRQLFEAVVPLSKTNLIDPRLCYWYDDQHFRVVVQILLRCYELRLARHLDELVSSMIADLRQACQWLRRLVDFNYWIFSQGDHKWPRGAEISAHPKAPQQCMGDVRSTWSKNSCCFIYLVSGSSGLQKLPKLRRSWCILGRRCTVFNWTQANPFERH